MRPLARSVACLFALTIVMSSMALVTTGSTASAASAHGTATRISAGADSSCAITPLKRLKCWGDNAYGQLGLGSDLSDRLKPMLVPNLSNVVQVSVGDYTTCAVLKGGKLKCWGYNAYGQVGDGTTEGRLVPRQVAGLTSRVAGVSVGSYHTCARLISGKAKCWGYNGYGEVGNGTSGNEYHRPVPVLGLDGVTQISAGNSYTCATVNGRAKCWGLNDTGNLGDSSDVDRVRPTQVTGLTDGVKRVSAGYYTTCAVLRGGKLKCWGYNFYGEVGNGTSENSYNRPVQVSGMTKGVTSVDTDYYFTCAVKGGRAKCWGRNSRYQLGNGTTEDSAAPQQVSGLDRNVQQIDISYYSGCALLKSGTAKCWGYNAEGQVGINSSSPYAPTPRTVHL